MGWAEGVCFTPSGSTQGCYRAQKVDPGHITLFLRVAVLSNFHEAGQKDLCDFAKRGEASADIQKVPPTVATAPCTL